MGKPFSLNYEVSPNEEPERYLMKKLIASVFLVLCLAFDVYAQESITTHGSTVTYARPDPANWKLVHNGIDERSKAYLLAFQRNPIKDAEGRPIEPVIALICESVPESLDVIRYSIAKRGQVPFDVKRVISAQDGSFTHRNSVGYEGEYKKGSVVHKVLVAHMRHGKAGLQVICDSTDGVYDKVEEDMRSFLRSITFKE
jgi:hypothetical protein